MKRKCPICEGEEFANGSIQANGRVGFRPNKTKFISIHTADVRLSARICLGCGFVMLTGDAKKVRALVGK